MSKFLTYEDRLVIARGLKKHQSFGTIGRNLGKDRTTIAKEIRRYSYDKRSGRPGYPFNPCKHCKDCKRKTICGRKCTHISVYKCSLCSECYQHCEAFTEDVSTVENKPSYVCNGCGEMDKCTLLKRPYDPSDAHIRAEKAVSEARTGILTDEATIARINAIITPLVRNRQVTPSGLSRPCRRIYVQREDPLQLCRCPTL